MFSKQRYLYNLGEDALVTIRQVAKEAGVSIGTVSRVLNNKPGVSDPTRQHVLGVAQKLNYSLPKLRHPSTTNVTYFSLLVRPLKDGLGSNPFYADVFHGVEQFCREHHINLSYSSLNIIDDRLHSLPPLIKDHYNNGIILLGAVPEEVVEAVCTFFQLPVVLVDNIFSHRAIDAVMADNTLGMHLAIEFLIQHGHTQIALIGGPNQHPSIIERQQGYRVALQRHNLPSHIIPRPGLDYEDGEQGVLDLLAQFPETTAIVCSNDLQATGVLRKLHELGYQVPKDFSVVGFDGIQLAQFTAPPITTIHVNRETMGRAAAQLLLERLKNPAQPATKTVVGLRLMERGSVSRPRPTKTSFDFIGEFFKESVSREF